MGLWRLGGLRAPRYFTPASSQARFQAKVVTNLWQLVRLKAGFEMSRQNGFNGISPEIF